MLESDLGKVLACARTIKGLTKTKLAELSGMSRVQVRKIESGQVSATMSSIQRLCSVLGLKASSLMKIAEQSHSVTEDQLRKAIMKALLDDAEKD